MTSNSPAVTFETFIRSLGTATLVSLGEIENPVSKTMEKDLVSAKQHIDILELLASKTVGNLNENESKLMQHLLYELRIKYIAATEGTPK